jgi:GMP synthase-like glutamine amidotransferase
VLGARLYRLAEPEIGWVRVTSKHPGLAEGPWPSWHVDAFDLPAGATELAVNEVCLQGFAAGPHAAVQFHPEATQPIVASWLANANPPPGREATDPLFKGAEGAWRQASANAGAFFSAWFDGGLTRR